jgi:hypothetical protein
VGQAWISGSGNETPAASHHLGHIRALAATGGKTVVMADLARMKAAGRDK